MDSTVRYFRCIRATSSVALGDVFPALCEGGKVTVLLGKSWTWAFGPDERNAFWEVFEEVAEADFCESVAAAERAMRDARAQQAALKCEAEGFGIELLGAGDLAQASGCSALAPVNPVGQIRNRVHDIKRRANDLAVTIKERQGALEVKFQQRLAAAMAGLGDMKGFIKKLEEVVHTVQLYLGRDEEVVSLRDGAAADSATPLCIRQNVLCMDEECAEEESHGIDFAEIKSFDRWLLSDPAHLQQVMPEPKGVVVLRVRRSAKDYNPATMEEALVAGAMNKENAKTYWLIRNGERLHRIWADIKVGARLLPNADEVEHFFFERGRDGEDTPIRPGSPAYMTAMEKADAVRRHYMRLMLVLQGLIDRTLLFAPYKDGVRPNLLDPASTEGGVHFLRDVEGTLTDGRPTFQDWLAEVNGSLQHGHRIAGSFPTYFGKDDEQRISPNGARGNLDDEVHVVQEGPRGLYFLFTRTDEIYRRGSYFSRGEFGQAKTPGRYAISRDDQFFVCIDSPKALIEDMEYYIRDRRHRSAYATMIPALKKAIEVKREESLAEAPFRALLKRKMEEAIPELPCSDEKASRLILWWKTKTKEHRALRSDDEKAWRMIVQRYVATVSVGDEWERNKAAVLDAVTRIPDAVYAYHAGGREFGVLCGSGRFLREETWRVTRGTAHKVGEVPHVLAQRAHYESFTPIFTTSLWEARPQMFSPAKHLNPSHYPALIEWVRANPWFEDADRGERIVAIYAEERDDETLIRAASLELRPTAGGWSRSEREWTVLPAERIQMPNGHERLIRWTGRKTPEFSYKHPWGTGTHVDFHGNLSLGWERDGRNVIWLDEGAVNDVRVVIAERNAHNQRAEALSAWARKCGRSAGEVFESVWRRGQLKKYLAEGGDTTFFEDHLKTLPKSLPSADFVASSALRALNAGETPDEIIAMGLAALVAKYSPLAKKRHFDDETPVEAPAAEVATLVAEGWVPPALSDAAGAPE